MTFTARFLWLIVCHCLSPKTADNKVTWDSVFIAAMIAEFKADFAWLLQAFMHERYFKVTITYPFPCMIFLLCRSAGVPILFIDHLKTPQGTVDIGLIRDEANELAPRRGPLPEVPPLGENLGDTVAHAGTATQATSITIVTTPVESVPGSSTTPRSSCSAPSPALVLLARFQQLEAQIATLLHHIQPWMQWSIAESEESMVHKME